MKVIDQEGERVIVREGRCVEIDSNCKKYGDCSFVIGVGKTRRFLNGCRLVLSNPNFYSGYCYEKYLDIIQPVNYGRFI